jgi:hypothetical protein
VVVSFIGGGNRSIQRKPSTCRQSLTNLSHYVVSSTVWRYQRDNQNPYIEEEQTTQWPKEKVQKDKQWSTKHTYKTKDRVTRTPLKTGSELIQYTSPWSGFKLTTLVVMGIDCIGSCKSTYNTITTMMAPKFLQHFSIGKLHFILLVVICIIIF